MSGHDWRGSRWGRTWECAKCGHRTERMVMPPEGEKVRLSREDTLRTFDGDEFTQWASCDELVALRVISS